jgi:acyl carrier protein
MKTQEFVEKLAEALELEQNELTIDTNFKSLEVFDSMSIMTIIAFTDEHFSKKFTAKELNLLTTVKSLKELIGIENFSD